MNDYRVPKIRFGRMIPCFLLLVSLLLNVALVVHCRIAQRFLRRFEAPPVRPPISLDGRYKIDAAPSLGFEDSGVNDREMFRMWQLQAREKLKEILRVDISMQPESVHIEGKVEVGNITRETLLLEKHDGSQIPGFLLLPETSDPRPAVIVIPGFSYGIIGVVGIEEDYQHSVALRLAEAGYVVLTLEIRGLGYLERMGEAEMEIHSYILYCLNHGRSMAGYTVSDVAAGLNYLISRKEIDSEQLGVLGFSSGGFPAVFLAALDDRIDAVVASGCIASFDSQILDSRTGSAMVVPGLVEWLDASDCLSMMAPRPMLAHWGRLDTWPEARYGSLTPASWKTIEAAKRAYSVLNSEDQLETLVSPNLSHEVDTPAVVDFFLRVMPIDKGLAPSDGIAGVGLIQFRDSGRNSVR